MVKSLAFKNRRRAQSSVFNKNDFRDALGTLLKAQIFFITRKKKRKELIEKTLSNNLILVGKVYEKADDAKLIRSNETRIKKICNLNSTFVCWARAFHIKKSFSRRLQIFVFFYSV